MVFGGIMLKKQEDPEAVNYHSWEVVHNIILGRKI